MRYVKKAAPYLCMVLKGILFIGFSIQIILGVCWICGNFAQVQDFPEPESVLYRALFWCVGKNPMLLYCLQLAVAFLTGFFFLQKLCPVEIGFAIWRGLALLTLPFALQCHLSVQPYSLMSSAFLLFLLSLLQMRRKRIIVSLLAALACIVVSVGLSGAVDSDRREMPGYSIEGALASRFAWPTLWNDFDHYGEELKTVPSAIVWEASFYPENIRIFQESLESQVGIETARKCYLQMAGIGWEYHKHVVIRQIGWDVLGYAVTPIIFPLQMAGKAYDSYSGRNYEVMREHTPILTRDYVDYACWWFPWMLGLSAGLALGSLLQIDWGSRMGSVKEITKPESTSLSDFKLHTEESQGKRFFSRNVCAGGSGMAGRAVRIVVSIGVCCLFSGLLILLLTMRGAGRMDYRESIAVGELWLVGPLLLMSRKQRKGLTE